METNQDNKLNESLSSCDTIYIVRHGMREDWANPSWRITAKNLHDTPLSAEGFMQAKEVAGFFRNTKHNISHIFVSPFTRTCQTATAVADELNLPIHLEYGVTEYLGPHEEIHYPSMTELGTAFPRINASYKSHTIGPKTETKQMLFDRARRVIQHLAEDYVPENQKKGDLLIVTHAASAIALVRGIVGDPELRVNCAVCSISKVVRDPKTNKWICEINGGTTHLSKGEQFGWEFPDEVKKTKL